MVQRRVLLALLALLAAAVAGSVGARPVSAQATVSVAVGDFYFCAPAYQGGVCETSVSAGDTVVWDFSASQSVHTTTECGASCDAPTSSPLWASPTMNSGTFSFTFTQPGTYLYYCEVHPALQRGRIVVQEAPVEPTAPSPTTADGTPQATNTPGPGLPRTGQGPDASSALWPLIALVVGGAFALGAGALARGRARRVD